MIISAHSYISIYNWKNIWMDSQREIPISKYLMQSCTWMRKYHICILIMYRFRLEISGVIHQSIPKRSVEGTGICRGGAVWHRVETLGGEWETVSCRDYGTIPNGMAAKGNAWKAFVGLRIWEENAESRSRRTGAGDFQSERYNSRLEFDIGNQRDSPAIPTADFRGKWGESKENPAGNGTGKRGLGESADWQGQSTGFL